MPQTVGEQARQIFLAKLQDHYSELDVSIRHGRYEPGSGFTFEDLEFRDPKSMVGSQPRTIAKVDRLTVLTDLKLNKVVESENPFLTKQIVIDGATVEIWSTDNHWSGETCDWNQGWSIEKLLPVPEFGPVCPRMNIRDVKLNLFADSTAKRPLRCDVRHVNVLASHQPDGTLVRQIQAQASGESAERITVRSLSVGDR
ncbi:MAG: hypothetical protein AAF989_13510, partial [Planctomycetota bacterium]